MTKQEYKYVVEVITLLQTFINQTPMKGPAYTTDVKHQMITDLLLIQRKYIRRSMRYHAKKKDKETTS